ncbi:MAG: excinuclease ABC subunit UvrA [Desulfobulbaceae bacterium]|nr:excinuclease ABC subunit UvrA [Desulfobulbaceae bacterium]
MEPKEIRIRGARMHNLKNIDVDLPRNRLIVFTGLSGSGKSSLAFDTLYAEGQRRYVESLSTYARQFLGQMDKPDVDSLEGLSPAVSIEQRTTSRNPRSTVGTITEIYDHLRLLFARVGHQYCPDCGHEITPQSIENMVENLLVLPEGTKCILLAPLVDGRKGEFVELFNSLRKDGFIRVRIDGELKSLDEEIFLEKTKRHTVEAVVDRIVIKPASRGRLAQSTATAVQLSEGFLLVSFPDSGEEKLFSERAACSVCGTNLLDLSPQLFSFNNPKGACEECGGLGVKHFFDPHLVVPNPDLTLHQGAIAPWRNRSRSSYSSQLLEALAKHFSFRLDIPFKKLPAKAQKVILHGTGREAIFFHYVRRRRTLTSETPFEGILPQLARHYLETGSGARREELSLYMNEQPCPTCQGARLKPSALAVKVGAWTINQLTALSIARLAEELPKISFSSQEVFISGPILKEINERLSFLLNVGLGYLSLDRTAATLSGGEAQRIRLASQIGSRLAGVLYILDEPSIGLHQRDNERLIRTLTSLRDIGNTVIVVEHDSETIVAADHVLDIGPGAGIHGGQVLYNGPVSGLLAEKSSLTGGFLSGRLEIELPAKRRLPATKNEQIQIRGAKANNLKKVNVSFPLGVMTCVTGVSGSGKSSLVMECLFKGAKEGLSKPGLKVSGQFASIKGLDKIDKIIDIDQSPIGRTPRSNPATYTGILTPVRELLAKLPESRARGYRPGRFSFNLKGGRCEACEGDGVIKIAMHFLPDIYVTCGTCNGKRYNQETLEIKYRGKNIADILTMNVEEALNFFTNIPTIKTRLQTMMDVGLSYISLGQSSVTLSGGEAQRIKLARELRKRSTGRTLYILDEPTTGLHPADIKNLLGVLSRLVESGNTAVIIEHNLDVIKTADHLIDLGPEGGDEGGWVVSTGPPEKIAKTKKSYTGMFLKQILG